jgi:hypothetical protein
LNLHDVSAFVEDAPDVDNDVGPDVEDRIVEALDRERAQAAAPRSAVSSPAWSRQTSSRTHSLFDP